MFNPTEQEINFDSFIKFPVFCFKLALFDFEPLNESPTILARLQSFLRTSFNALSILAGFLVGELSLCMYSLLIADNFVAASANVPNIVTAVLIYYRAFVTFKRRRSLWNIFEELRSVFAAHGHENSKYKIKQYLDGYHLLIRIYAFCINFISGPLIVLPTVAYALSGTMKLSVNYWFPFDAFTPGNFPLALVWTDLIAWISATCLVSVDSLLYALITVISMEFDVLKFDFMDINLIPMEKRSEQLKILVERHNSKLFEISDKLQDIFESTFLLSFGITSLVLCYIAFIVSNTSDLAVYSFNGTLLSIVCGQMLLLCFYGK